MQKKEQREAEAKRAFLMWLENKKEKDKIKKKEDDKKKEVAEKKAEEERQKKGDAGGLFVLFNSTFSWKLATSVRSCEL